MKLEIKQNGNWSCVNCFEHITTDMIDNYINDTNILKPTFKKQINKKIKIGYYSADFHDHATSNLMANLLELHDRSKFEVIGFYKFISRCSMIYCYFIWYCTYKCIIF